MTNGKTSPNPPRISLHAAARAAQHRGRPDLDEDDLRASPRLRGRWERAILRLIDRAEVLEQDPDRRSALLISPTRTRILIVIDGTVVTELAASAERIRFGQKRVDRLRRKFRQR